MAIKNTALGGTNWVDEEHVSGTDLNDTFNAAKAYRAAAYEFSLPPVGSIVGWDKDTKLSKGLSEFALADVGSSIDGYYGVKFQVTTPTNRIIVTPKPGGNSTIAKLWDENLIELDSEAVTSGLATFNYTFVPGTTYFIVVNKPNVNDYSSGSAAGTSDGNITVLGGYDRTGEDLTNVWQIESIETQQVVTSTLPDGWLSCDGSVISDADSPMDGETLPALNGTTDADSLFLRGNSTSGGTGGNTSHAHAISSLEYADNNNNVNERSYPGSASNIPSYYEIQWIMRVK